MTSPNHLTETLSPQNMSNLHGQEAVNAPRWHKFPVLDDGFICLVDVMGDDSSIVQAARVSYGKDSRDGRPTNLSGIDSGKWGPDIEPDPQQQKKNRDLIRYLMRHTHTTPLEMCELKFLIRVPMDCWRQWIRHRMASVNEYSTRYTEAIDSQQKTPPDQWRLQSGNNKQGSQAGNISSNVDLYDNPSEVLGRDCNEYLTEREAKFHTEARKLYEERIRVGIAREQARKDLPLSTYTEAYWKIDLHNLLHFLSLRMDSHAQLEIRSYANIIGNYVVKPIFPIIWEAFEDYNLRRNAVLLTALDVKVIQAVNDVASSYSLESIIPNKREREECISKLHKLGFNILF